MTQSQASFLDALAREGAEGQPHARTMEDA
jgi:hypothetical protein